MNGVESGNWMVVGHSAAPDSGVAGAEAAGQAVASMPDEYGRLMLIFAPARVDPATLLAAICAQTPDCLKIAGVTTSGDGRLVSGGTLIGGPSPAGAGREEGDPDQVVVAILGGRHLQVATRVIEHACDDLYASGQHAAEALDGIDSAHSLLLLLADGAAADPHLVRGAYSHLGSSVPIAGACSAFMDLFEIGQQFHGDGSGARSFGGAVVAIGIGSPAPIGIGTAHGLRQDGPSMVVTSSSGRLIHTLDGEPALEVYRRHLGLTAEEVRDPVTFLNRAIYRPLGLSRRDGDDIRVVHACDPGTASLLTLSEVAQGALVSLQRTDPEALIAAATESGAAAALAMAGAPAAAVLIFDCIGRRMALEPKDLRSEREAIIRAAGGVPLAGFYSFAEFARSRGARGLHHLTVVTVAIG